MRSKLGTGFILSAIFLAVTVQLAPHVFRWLVLSEETPLTAEAFDPLTDDFTAEWERWRSDDGALEMSLGDFALSPTLESPELTDETAAQPDDRYLEADVQYFPEALEPAPSGPRLLPVAVTASQTDAVAEIEPADSSDEPPLHTANAKPPGRIEHPGDAQPISPEIPQETALDVIEQECPQASDEERRIWSEELKGLPLPSIREILRLRRLIGSDLGLVNPLRPAPPQSPPKVAILPPPRPEIVSPAVPPISDRASESTDDALARINAARDALLQVREIHLNNLANAGTHGFLCSRGLLADAPYARWEFDDAGPIAGVPASVSIGFGTRLAATCLDLRPGELRQTGRPLDLAIEGDGFLRVAAEEGAIAYTRAGWLTRNEQGRLAVSCGNGPLPLLPEIQLPDSYHHIQISSEGAVRLRHDESSALLEVGRIELVRFPNAEYLAPQGGQLLLATDASGQALSGPPGANGLGRIRQGVLEASNVELEQELLELERIGRQLAALRRARTLLQPADIPQPPDSASPAEPPAAARTADRDAGGPVIPR